MAVIKRAQIFIDSNKIAELQSASEKAVTNGERMHGADGVIGATVGNPESDYTCSMALPLSRSAGLTALRTAFKNQSNVVVSMLQGTELTTVACKVNSMSVTTEARTGSLMIEFTMINTENPTYS